MSLAINGSFFNTHRMLYQYVTDAYFPGAGRSLPRREAELQMAR